MKLNVPKSWFEEKIALEKDYEIGAGNINFITKNNKLILYVIQSYYSEAGERLTWTYLNDRPTLKEARILLKEYQKTTGDSFKYRILKREIIEKVVK